MRTVTTVAMLCVIQACASTTASQTHKPMPDAQSSNQSPGQSSNQIAAPIKKLDVPEQAAVKRVQTGAAKKLTTINHPSLAEISGIATASTDQVLLWAINDSGNRNSLFAIAHDGSIKREYTIPAKNRDWESMSNATINGKPYLIIGDTGDNLRWHPSYNLHLIAEPRGLSDKQRNTLPIERTITFSYPDGKHNIEAMAATDDAILLISKEPLSNGEQTAGKLYQLPLESKQGITHVAQYLGQLMPRSGSLTSRLAAALAGVDLDQATSMAVSESQQAVYVLTYRQVLRYDKAANQSWGDALLGMGTVIHTHGLRQAEALSVADDGVIWFTSEKLPAPIWSIPTRPIFE